MSLPRGKAPVVSEASCPAGAAQVGRLFGGWIERYGMAEDHCFEKLDGGLTPIAKSRINRAQDRPPLFPRIYRLTISTLNTIWHIMKT